MQALDFCKLGLAVIETEAASIQALTQHINQDFARACTLMLACEGRIIVMGMGKSGHIGGKIAATLASTGTPAFFVHPGEASHGDMGMITQKDVVLAISNSGSTPELMTILPLIKRLQVPFITLTGKPGSPLAENATVHIDVSVTQEACPLNLAPTSSTTAALVMGDALAIALLEGRGFTTDDFALAHPGGILGRRLLLRVSDVMISGDRMPTVTSSATVTDSLLEVTAKKLGMTLVLNPNKTLAGIFTDGDLRRAVDKTIDLHQTKITDVMTVDPKTIPENMLAAEALSIMENYKITTLVVVDTKEQPCGVLHMHDIIKAGVV